MNLVCLMVALLLSVLLCFVSYMQLLYLESLRLIRREFASLEFFRETLAQKIGLDLEHGSLAFSLIKHVSLFSIGVFYLCAFVRPGTPHWQSVVEALTASFVVMLVSTYFVPQFLYRRTSHLWLNKTLPATKFLAALARPLAALVRGFQSLLD